MIIDFWELLTIFVDGNSKLSWVESQKAWREEHKDEDTYPKEISSKGGPVPIREADDNTDLEEWYWARDEYIYALLALRSVRSCLITTVARLTW